MWDQRYASEDYVYGTQANDFLRQQFRRLPERGKILSLAEGEGRNAVFLAQQGFQVSAVDASAVGLEKAEKLAKKRGVSIECIHADLATFELGDNCWQGIVSIFCHLPPALRQRVHSQVQKALVHGGIFLLEAYTPDQLKHGTGGPPLAEMMVSPENLQTELPGLHFELLEEKERQVLEGAFHTGVGAVVQAIARK